MAARGRKQKPKKISSPAHPIANNIIIACIGGEKYMTYITHFELKWFPPGTRKDDEVAWTMKFSYLISKKRENGLIAGWERNPNDPFDFEIRLANPNKYQQHQTYKGVARFNFVEEHTDKTPREAHFVLDILNKNGV